ncbi:hypothetical protein ACFP3Q_01015 [Nocardioides sp. GCM10027113]|uniref:hypothetical protein n=1 Tax=unclassified Nocardioides TaxID=2615069 RepID=UPI0036103718
MTGKRQLTPREDEHLNRTVKQLEWWALLRVAFPLVFVGLGGAGLYGAFAWGPDGVKVFWLGVPLGLAGSVCAFLGYRGRLREISEPGAPTARHYPWLFIGWALVVAGLLIPPYSVA